MKVLEFVKTSQNYSIRIWMDEIGPNAVDVHTYGLKAPKDLEQTDYEEQILANAKMLSGQKLAELPEVTARLHRDDNAIAEQQAAVTAQEEASEALQVDEASESTNETT